MDNFVDWHNVDSKDIAKTKGRTNCPNCGAPINTERCPYCGALFIDFACMDADKPFYMKVKQGDNIHIVKVMLTSTSVHRDDPYILYSDYNKYVTYSACPLEITMDFVMVP